MCADGRPDLTGKFACLGYFKAVDHFSQMLARDYPGVIDKRKLMGCIPQGVTVEQAVPSSSNISANTLNDCTSNS
jgi:hypothetical protein